MNDEQLKRFIRIRNPSDPLQYGHDLVKDLAFEKLTETIKACKDCDIHTNVRTLPTGRTDAPVVVISEAATLLQKDLVTDNARAGMKEKNLFEAFLGRYGIDKDNLFYMNAVNCFPCRINEQNETVSRTPVTKEVKNCRIFVDYALKIVQPKLIILLGATALNLFKKSAISKERGELFYINGVPVVPTYHPDYFDKIAERQDPEMVDSYRLDFEQDLLVAFRHYEKLYPAHPLMNYKGE